MVIVDALSTALVKIGCGRTARVHLYQSDTALVTEVAVDMEQRRSVDRAKETSTRLSATEPQVYSKVTDEASN